jgi:hypothetical protein
MFPWQEPSAPKSTQERRLRNNCEPRFQRKHGGCLTFNLILSSGDEPMSSTDQNKPTGKSGRRKGKAEQRNQPPGQNLKADRNGSSKISEPDQSLSAESDQQSARPDQLVSPEPDQVLSPQLDQQQNREPGHLLDVEQDQRSTEQPGRQQNIEPGQIVSREAAQQLDPEPAEAQSAKPNDGQAADAEEHIGATPAPVGITAAAAEGARVNLQSLANAYGDYTRKSLEQTKSFVDKLSGVRTLDKVMEAHAEFAKQSYENFVSGSQRICELQSELAKQAFKPLQRLANRSREQR